MPDEPAIDVPTPAPAPEAPPPSAPERVAAHHLDAGHHHGHARLPPLRFLEEIKRRNVGRVAILYIIVSYVVLEVFEMFYHLLEMPPWTGRAAVLLAVLGFPIALLVAWAYEITPEGLKPTDEVPRQKSITRQTGRRLDRAIIGVLVIALTYFVVDKFWLSKHMTPAAAPTLTAKTTADVFAPPPHSIAVLPFLNMSGDKEQDYFSDGLTEELLNSLAEISELQVAARTSAFSFKGKDTDIGTIARKLNVGAVLEGSVRRSGNTVRVTTQLINAVTGFHLWSHAYDRDLGDVLKLETEIANDVVGALKVNLLGDEVTKIEVGGTHNPAAFDAYLRARRLLRSATGSSDEMKAIAELTEAIRLDPAYALAFAWRSLGYSNLGDGEAAAGMTPKEILERQEADAREATKLSPELAEGYDALGRAAMRALDLTQAREAFERALALAPGNTATIIMSSYFLGYMGQYDGAISAARRAVTLDPLNANSHFALGLALYTARRYREATASFSDAIGLFPEIPDFYAFAGRAHYMLGDLENAKSSCEHNPDDPGCQWCLAMVYGKLGRRTDAESQIAKMKSALGESAAYQYAATYAQWGDSEKALEWLSTAMRRRDGDLDAIKTDPLMDPLRNEPRFEAIVRELKFPP